MGQANICPISRKGIRTERANYWANSLTFVVFKVLEGVVRDELMDLILINIIVAAEHHGFVPKKGCVSNLLETLEFVTEAP